AGPTIVVRSPLRKAGQVPRDRDGARRRRPGDRLVPGHRSLTVCRGTLEINSCLRSGSRIGSRLSSAPPGGSPLGAANTYFGRGCRRWRTAPCPPPPLGTAAAPPTTGPTGLTGRATWPRFQATILPSRPALPA